MAGDGAHVGGGVRKEVGYRHENAASRRAADWFRAQTHGDDPLRQTSMRCTNI